MRRLQARVLANAAEAIRIITALVYPILPDAAAKVWQQLGQGEIADAAKQAFLTDLAWGGLKAGTQFGDPAPLFPRAEKDAIEPYAESRRRKQQERRGSCGGQESSEGSAEARFAPDAKPPGVNIRGSARPRPTRQTPTSTKEALTQTTAAPRMTARTAGSIRPRCIPFRRTLTSAA